MPVNFSLAGRVAAVTGANTGLGRAIAEALAGAGADVACIGRSDPAETLATIKSLGRRGHWVSADLGSKPDYPGIVGDVVAKLGGLDILVNNAGIIRRNNAIDFTEADWDAVLDVNLKAVFFLSQAAARHMIPTGGGKIINIASMLSFQGGIRVPSYTASKSGIAGLTKLLANEWAGSGINVNAIAPGYFATNNTAALQADVKRNAEILGRIPAGRLGVIRRTWAVPPFFWRRARRTTSRGSYCPSTAAGWRAESTPVSCPLASGADMRPARPWIRVMFCAALCAAGGSARAAPDHVDITWLSIANIHFDFGTGILVDGYITRIPQANFHGGGGGLGGTLRAMRPDETAVREVFDAIGGRDAVQLLLTGHSHFDHSFDTPVWARLSGANVVGSNTTCLQLQAAKLPASRCRAVLGGERLEPGAGIRLYVIRWNHSGDPAKNPEQHDPRELDAVPVPDAQGGLRAGVAEDFPNGGGNRAFLFVFDTADGPLSVLFQDSASAVDLTVPIVMDGHDYGAPLENLRRALTAAKLPGVDLWIATGGRDVAALVLPVLRPKAYLPVHWDGLFGAFKAGVPQPFSDPELEKLLAASGVTLVKPAQYLDKWRLDRKGVTPIDNKAAQHALGFR